MPRIVALLALITVAIAADLSVVPDRADGVYQPGEAVTWTVTATGEAPTGQRFSVRSGGVVEVVSGALTFADGKATVTARLDQPGTLLLEIPVGAKRVLGGAAVAWERIPVSAPEPADFSAFWQAKLAELAAVPANPVMTPVESGNPAVKLWTITMANIRGTQIRGYLARPANDAPCPAMLVVQYAGVYALDKAWSVGPAAQGWLVLNINAHDLPVDQPKDFYAQQNVGAIKNYPAIGREDRDTSYFLRMYLSCYRGAEYLATRPDWNRTTLLVQGGSQGGLQAIVTAGLHPAITVATANVPAGCDHTGAALKRTPGWPRWTTDDPRTVTASTYYDVVNFARRVRCPVLVGMGLIDTVCPPGGVFAMYNQLTGAKRLVLMPGADHGGPHGPYYGVLNAWWTAARDGKPLPMR